MRGAPDKTAIEAAQRLNRESLQIQTADLNPEKYAEALEVTAKVTRFFSWASRMARRENQRLIYEQLKAEEEDVEEYWGSAVQHESYGQS